LEGDEFEYFYFVTNTELPSEKVSLLMKNAAMLKITSKKPSMIWRLAACCSNHFGPTKRSFTCARSLVADDAHLQLVFVFQDGFRKRDRIPAANQDV
jgi:hypothetical protein